MDQRAHAEGLPALTLSASELDFGEILPSEAPEKTIRVTNNGTKEIVIRSIASTCSCTVVESKLATLAPGASGDIIVRLAVSDYPSNKVNTRVYIVPAGSEPERLSVEVRATIKPEYVLTPEGADFGEIKLATQPVKTIILKQNGKEPPKILRVDASGNVSATFKQAAPKPATGTTLDAQPRPSEWIVEIKAVPGPLPGPLTGRVTITTNIKRMPKIDVPVSGRVLGLACTITPKVIVFGPSKPGETVAQVRIEGSNELQLARVQCSDAELEFTNPTRTDDGAIIFDVKLTTGATPGDEGGKLHLELIEGPSQQTFTVPYFGTVAAPSP
ncbi:MAG: DUF1573 domain-containing protein [Candidatus Hydrogenedentes bacterium]|nr:DUF1573 domain-containing protein [Candidatus Hydrogenedentota bacterium]